MPKHPLRQRIGREAVKFLLARLLSWRPLTNPSDGFTIILGVPWDLRHLLNVNLRFVEKTDLSRLEKLFVVFDRRKKPEMAVIESKIRAEFSALPLDFLWYPPVSGAVIERVHVSTFYNSMNTTLALSKCNTKYAVLHDFDLYPLRPDHFTSIVLAMQSKNLRFSGHELTHFDGLTDDELQIGTWALGVDVEWLRANYQPIDCFHRISEYHAREYNLDPFAWLQFQTSARGLTGKVDPSEFCHVKNLCSTYLRFIQNKPAKVAWRLHYLWYLEDLSGYTGRMKQIVRAMDSNSDGVLVVDSRRVCFSDVHASCANVLRTELLAMDHFLFGKTRDDTVTYLDSFESFIHRVGDNTELRESNGTIKWSPN
jgi:hypothetical protein